MESQKSDSWLVNLRVYIIIPFLKNTKQMALKTKQNEMKQKETNQNQKKSCEQLLKSLTKVLSETFI